MRTAVLVVGVVLTVALVFAMCQAMIVPRRSSSRIVWAVNGTVAALARLPLRWFRTYKAQDRWLSGSAPISVLLQLIVYVVLLIITMGLVMFGTTDLSLNESIYQSGASMTTLGIVEPVNEASGIAIFVAAFLGLVVIAIFIGYLMALNGAYVSRESGLARAAILAGEPAWGPLFLVRGRQLGLPRDELPDPSLWLEWMSTTRLNHEVNPVLMEFRAMSSRRHWVTTALAALDAASLQASITEVDLPAHQLQFITEGSITMWALAAGLRPAPRPTTRSRSSPVGHNWDIERILLDVVRGDDPAPIGDFGVTRAQFDQALQLLGDQVTVTSDEAWRRFRVIRSLYFEPAAALACRLHAVPAPWSGPRDPDLRVEYPPLPDGTPLK
jgi:hypothetical protein